MRFTLLTLLTLCACAEATAAPKHLEAAGVAIRADVDDGTYRVGSGAITAWIIRSAEIVAQYYDRFPTTSLHIRVVPEEGDGVRGGKTFGREGGFIRVAVGRDVTADQSLSYLVANLDPGARVPFEILRNGQRMTLTATLATRPSAEELAGFTGSDDDNDGMPDEDDQSQQDQATSDSIGISTIPLTPTIARQVGVDPTTKGVIITSVDSSSDAGQKLQRGLVIVAANGQPVTTPQALASQVAAAKRAGRDQVLLYLALPKGQNRFIAVKIKK